MPALKNRILIENYYLHGDLEQKIDEFVTYYNTRRYHENLSNLTPEDVWLGRGQSILEQRRKTKEKTLKLRKQLHQQKIAALQQPMEPETHLIFLRHVSKIL